jgi:hypothetical protein
MIATLGIDYGYQPDGAGGLEYIVQVPAELLRQGTTSFESSIDPQIRPFVSKVIVRCGNDRLPKNDGGLLSSMKTARSGNDRPDVYPNNRIDSESRVSNRRVDSESRVSNSRVDSESRATNSHVDSESRATINRFDSESRATRPIPATNFEGDTMPVPIPSLSDPTVKTVSNRPQADGGAGMVLPGSSPDRSVLPNPNPNNRTQGNSLRDLGNQLNQSAQQIQNNAREAVGGLFQQNRGQQDSPYADPNPQILQSLPGSPNYGTSSLSLGNGSNTAMPSFGQPTSQQIPRPDDQNWRPGSSLPSTDPMQAVGRYSGTIGSNTAQLGNGVYPTADSPGLTSNGNLTGYGNLSSSGNWAGTTISTNNGNFATGTLTNTGSYANGNSSGNFSFNTPDPRSIGNPAQFGTQFRNDNFGNTLSGNGSSILPNALTNDYQRQASLPTNPRIDSGFGISNTSTNNQVLPPGYDPRLANAGYPTTHYLGNGRTNLVNMPVSRKFLDVLLLCSVIANAYLLIGLSSLLSKYRNLVANVRGVAVTSQPT